MRLFFGMRIERPFFRRAMDTHIGHIRQPPTCHFIEMFQRSKRATIQQALFHVIEMPFDFALGFRPTRTTCPRTISIMRRERQKSRVVNRFVFFPTRDHDLHVVVQTSGRHTLKVLKRTNMLGERRFEVLPLGETEILPARITKQIAEQVNATSAFGREIDVVNGPVHLCLDPR